jgi:ribosomal protein S18 acetylase RimI-like enzyme
MKIRPFHIDDEQAVVALWQRCDMTRPWNDPHKDIQRKLTVQPEMFLVGVEKSQIIATIMVGYEGHRGWINYLAVDPQHRRRGHGTALMAEAERMLRALGCPKMNLQVRNTNEAAQAFYRDLGYIPDQSISLGKRLVDDEAAS